MGRICKNRPVFNSRPPEDLTYSPYRSGWNGYLHRHTNPHPLGDPDGQLWELGWLDAQRKGKPS